MADMEENAGGSGMVDLEARKARIREFYDRSHRGDLSVYDDLLTPDFVNHGGPAGELHGPQAFRDAYVGFSTAFSDFHTTIDIMVAEGDYVVAYGEAGGTHDGPFMGLPPTNRQMRWTGVAIYRLDDDLRIAERWQEIDGLSMFGQLGLLPPPPGAPSES